MHLNYYTYLSLNHIKGKAPLNTETTHKHVIEFYHYNTSFSWRFYFYFALKTTSLERCITKKKLMNLYVHKRFQINKGDYIRDIPKPNRVRFCSQKNDCSKNRGPHLKAGCIAWMIFLAILSGISLQGSLLHANQISSLFPLSPVEKLC